MVLDIALATLLVVLVRIMELMPVLRWFVSLSQIQYGDSYVNDPDYEPCLHYARGAAEHVVPILLELLVTDVRVVIGRVFVLS